MNFSHFFVDRPVFAAVLSIITIVVGMIAFNALPMTQYPEIAPPTIVVSASYPGANAQTIADTVAAPLEQEINGVEDMIYMLSQSTSSGELSITVTFALGTNLEDAQVLVQNRVATAEPRLPEEVRALGVTTRKSSPDLMMVVHMESPDNSRDQLYISNYALLQVRDVLSRIDGVGEVRMFGARDYSMRVWLDPQRMGELSLTTGDVVAALREQNVQVAGGALGQPPVANPPAFQTQLQLRGRLDSVKAFEEIVVKTGDDGQLVRVKDVARVELGAESYVNNSYKSGSPAVALAIFQRPGSNALDTADQVLTTMEELSEGFPQGVGYDVIYNPTQFIEESIAELLRTIAEAVALVTIVMLIFLHSWRAAIVPIAAIPVSLIGTLAVMQAFGYSINNLTLFGLVLAVGIVVDDAIVVVENVERNIAEGKDPRTATHVTMTEVATALIATTLVLVAVFVPSTFLSGITGQFFKQFGLTIATATVISSINSLTLSPALCAILLRKKEHHCSDEEAKKLSLLQKAARAFDKGFDKLSNGYAWLVAKVIEGRAVMLVLYTVLIALTAWNFQRVPTGFIPQQDQGYIITVVQLPAGASLARTDEVTRRVEQLMLETDGIVHTATFAGFNGATFTNASNAAAVFSAFAPFSERMPKGLTANRILAETNQKVQSVLDANVFVVPPPPVRGIGNAGGWKMMIQDRRGRGLDVLNQATQDLMVAAWQDSSSVAVFSPFQANAPQIFIDVDRVRAEKLNVPVSNVFNALEVYIGSVFVNDFNLFGRTFQVRAQGDAPFRLVEEDIRRLETRSTTGAMVPLGSLIEFRYEAGPERVPRYNIYQAAELQGNAAPGVSSGDAIKRMGELADQILPPGISYAWTDLAYQEVNIDTNPLIIFALSVLFAFLVLAAQYESWSLPLAIVLIVPMCLLSALAGVQLLGLDNNILTQIGFIVLIALACKNAILIVEFAKQEEANGKGIVEAAIESCRTRLRPIMMTSFAFILGVVPLLIASGAGAEMRQALGTAVFFGMIGVTVFGLVFTPVFYVLIRKTLTSLGFDKPGPKVAGSDGQDDGRAEVPAAE
ncbi:MAG: efflux RND transporter permease subunit [Alphaproteobacteria bacterium]|nr:efflux RND transporter permease subunit [Alphaproteobacteria bacterium SS10]